MDSTLAKAAPAGDRCPCCGARVKPPRGDRRFNLVDAAILVAASWLCLALARPVLPRSGLGPGPWWTALLLAGAILVAATPATLALRLRQPRPSLRRLSRRPGFVASLAATATLALSVPAVAILSILRAARARPGAPGSVPPPTNPDWWIGVLFEIGPFAGASILVAWLALAVSGRRRPDPGPFDITGRALGTLWAILFVVAVSFRLARMAG